MFRNLNLRTKILASIGLVVLLSFSLVILIVSIKSVDMAKASAYQIARETASKNGNYVRAELDVALDTVRTLSYTFQEMKLSHDVDRETMNQILIKVLKDNPQFVATWTLWEPNALDGRDAEFINKTGYDSTGRFIPYWSIQSGKEHLEPLVNYQVQGAGDYYLIPRKSKRETIIEPYIYPINGKDVLVTSVVVPLIVGEKFVGVVGIDIALDTIQKVVSEIKPFETGYASLISNEGKYVAHNDISQIGKTVNNSQVREAIKSGISYTTTNKGVYQVYVPIKIGRTTTPWSMAVSVPESKILENAASIRNFTVIIGIIALLIIGLVIFQVASSITNQHLMLEIGERRQIEEKALRLASIVESTDDGIIGMTLDGIIIDWNRGAEGIYGYHEAEIIGESIIKLIPDNQHIELDEILANISRGMPMTHYETIRQKKDGQLIHVYLTVSPIKDHSGKIVGASKIVRDVTAQKKLEKEMIRMDQMRLVGEMAASIGHEVRNPMTTVRGFLQLFGENFAKYSEYIPLMISELDRANAIITEFLSISRTKTTEFARQSLNDIIECILPLVQVEAINEEKSVILKLNAIPDLLLDHKEIRQVILNLARNGIEAMGKGGNLKIETFSRDDEVILAIHDEGVGINPEIMDRLGTPFFTTKEQGTGLGLAVCFGIAARHNAKINVETSPKGSTFFVRFKL
ncbi:PAS domain S-box protein [Desulfosporosinus sp. OT]|uniref:PAS domain S-box protein n=1 Tax=Desulfosporosinus sp. OT TaxID=913865 RepID=UPI0002EB0A8D|nr:PAS domain S-box protein [Desulfosporosinus sp. OT]